MHGYSEYNKNEITGKKVMKKFSQIHREDLLSSVITSIPAFQCYLMDLSS